MARAATQKETAADVGKEEEVPNKESTDTRTPEEIAADTKAAEEEEANRLKTLEQGSEEKAADTETANA